MIKKEQTKMVYQYQKQYTQQIVKAFENMTSQDKRAKRSITTTDKTSSAGSKKIFDPQLQSFTKRTRFDSGLHRDNSKIQKLTIDKLVQKIIMALDHFYSQDQSGFYLNTKQFLLKGIQSWKLKIIDRMNTYQYVQMAIGHKPYVDIQSEIIKQWKKNYLLFAIMTYWYNGIQKIKLLTLKQFQQKYDLFRDFISQVSFLIFQGWFVNWQKRFKNQKVSALDKIFEQTSHFIITESSEFKRVHEKIILPLIQYETHGKKIDWKFELSELKAKKCVFDLDRQDNLNKTIQILRKFSKQVKLLKKIQLIRQYRATLDSQLQYQCSQLNKSNIKQNVQVLQKDDYITALIYCIIHGQLIDIQNCMKYMQTLMGENMNVLSKLQLNSFAVDILAAIDFLCQKGKDKKQQYDVDYLHNLTLHGRFVSSPLIPNQKEFSINDIIQHVTSKHITEFVEKE